MEDILDQGTQASQSTQNVQKIALPNAGGILTMGILSLVLWGLIGLILGIIGLSMSGKALATYREDPNKYTLSSYKNANAGKICSIIGICISGLVFLITLLVIVANA